MTRAQPTVRDRPLWALQLLDHRRALLELILTAFPDVLQRNRTKVDIWRMRLRPSS